MKRGNMWQYLLAGMVPLALATAYSCGSAEGAGTGLAGSACSKNGDCASDLCVDGVCVGNSPGGLNRPSGSACTGDGECASGSCVDGVCAVGSGLTDGAACSVPGECASGVCVNGICGGSAGTGTAGAACEQGGDCASGVCVDGKCAAVGGGVPATTTIGPHYDGSGDGFRPLTTGCGPDTADQCTGTCEQTGGEPATVIRAPATLCFAGEGDATPDDPSVVIEQVIETVNGVSYVHIRVTFDPSFVDATYGTSSSEGWPVKRGHTFADLVGSDHTELLLTDGSGNDVMNFKVDLITEDPDSPCGYGTLGVTGGDGAVLLGDPECVLGVATSMDRNLNHCGFDTCYTQDSPTYEEAPTWDNRLVYEVWIALECFGTDGFGQAYITYVHASPAKTSSDTIQVEPVPCPVEWDEPYCPPSIGDEGGNCFSYPQNPPPDGGTTDGGTPGETLSCPPNYTVYVDSDGNAFCVPIPYANYENKEPCPDGYALDLGSEGQYCLPESP